MKFALYFICFSFIFISCKSDTINCENFKIGRFVQNIEEQDFKVYSVKTKYGLQIDSSKYGKSIYKLTWFNTCNYEAQLKSTTVPISKKYIGRKYFVSIIESKSANQFIYSCRADAVDFEDQDTIVKI